MSISDRLGGIEQRYGDVSIADASRLTLIGRDVPVLVSAVRAVLDLHKPRESCCDDCGPQQCEECEAWEWPCQTVRAIATALGEEARNGK